MIRVLALSLALGAAAPALAEEEAGRDLMSEALRLFMRGLIQEMDPAIEGLEGLLDEFPGYHPPEVMPNGDIIIRKRQPGEPQVGEGGEVEL
ncbi:MAG: hypothetical protein OIF48_08130 [Silicimonas sp.]|nr:hypothetical protein [Silicimonas sp.]